MNKRLLLLMGVLFFIGVVNAQDINVWSGQYYSGSTFNVGTFEFNFTVYDSLTGGEVCYTNITSLTTGALGDWRTDQYGVNDACSNLSNTYYLSLSIDGVEQSPRRKLSATSLIKAIVSNTTYTENWYNHTNKSISWVISQNYLSSELDPSFVAENQSLWIEARNKVNDTYAQWAYNMTSAGDSRFIKTIGENNLNGNLNINGNLTIIGSYFNSTVEQQILNGTLYPSLDSIFNIGSAGLYWSNGYFRQVLADSINTPLNVYWYNQTIHSNSYTDSINNSLALWVDSIYLKTSNIVNFVGNWTADKPSYYTKTQVDSNLSNYYLDSNPDSFINQATADGLYSGIEWDYNQTSPAISYLENTYNDTWSSTYNSSYAVYSFGANNFSGTGNFTTTGVIQSSGFTMNSNINGSGNFKTTGNGDFARMSIADGYPYHALDVSINSTVDLGSIQSPFINIGEKQNRLLQSEVFNSVLIWRNNTGRLIISNSDLAPTGTLIAEILNGTITGSNVWQNTTNQSLGAWTFSVYLRAFSPIISNVSIKLNSTNESGKEEIVNLTSTWKRYSISYSFVNVSGNITVSIIMNNNNVSAWGAQLDQYPYARSYYPTTTGTVATTQTTYMPFALTSAGALTGVGVAVGGALSGATTGAFSGIITNTIQALFISQDGIVTTASTNATAAAPINRSPRIRLTSNVWDLNVSAARATNWIIENNPRVGGVGNNSFSTLNFDFGYNSLIDSGMFPIMNLGSNGTLDILGTAFDVNILNNSNFTADNSWDKSGGWRINPVTKMANYTFALGATGNLTQNLSFYNITVKPNRQYEFTYNVSGASVAGCLAYIPESFANARIYLPGVSITTAGIIYDVNFRTNSNPSNFTITAVCTAGQFFLDTMILREVTSGDIIANGKFTGGGTNGIKIDGAGNVNITGGNLSINNNLGLTRSINVTNSSGSCWLNFTSGILTWSDC